MVDRKLDFAAGAVHPIECLQSGWQLIKDQYWLIFAITLVGGLIGGLVPLILLGPCMCGIFLCLIRKQRGQAITFEMLFKGFDYFVQSLIATLIMMVPVLVIGIPAYLVFIFSILATMPDKPGQHPDAAAMLPMFIGMGVFFIAIFVISALVQIAFFFIYPLIVDHGLTGMEAVKNSARAGFANFWGLLGLVLLNALLTMVGVMCCYVGVFFVIPITMAAQLQAYRQVFPAGTALPEFDAGSQ